MKNFEIKVKKLIKERKLSIEDFAIKVGMTKQNFYLILKRGDLNVSYLEKMSNILDVPISYFFNEVGDVPADVGLPSTDDKDKKIKQQRKKIKELEEDVKLFKSLLAK